VARADGAKAFNQRQIFRELRFLEIWISSAPIVSGKSYRAF
jgi:hypothetical protein